MQSIKSYIKKSLLGMLTLILLLACVSPPYNKTSAPQEKILTPILPATFQSMLAPSLLAEWTVGEVSDMAWSPNNRMFAVNYWLEGNDSNRFVQAFDANSLDSMWTAENSLASDLVFTPDGQFIVESNIFAPFFYWRSIEQGNVVRQGTIKDSSQIRSGDCNGGGQIILANTRENIVLSLDANDLRGPSWRTNHTINIRQWNLDTGNCKNLIQYQGSFTLFDLNSSGTFLAFGGEGKDDSVVIWDIEKQDEVCRTPKVDFGRFVPSENTLAVVREQKIVFIDASTCQEFRELNIAPSFGYEKSLAFSPNGKLIAMVRDSIQIIEMSTGEILAQIAFPKDAVPHSDSFFLNGIKFSPNGQYLLIVLDLLESIGSGEVQLWRLSP